jgi:hypothetical protein
MLQYFSFGISSSFSVCYIDFFLNFYIPFCDEVKLASIKFYEKQFIGRKVVTCRQADVAEILGSLMQLIVPREPR